MKAPVSTYVTRPLRPLAVVCRQLGRDDHGRACTTCALRDLCDPKRQPLPAESISAIPGARP